MKIKFFFFTFAFLLLKPSFAQEITTIKTHSSEGLAIENIINEYYAAGLELSDFLNTVFDSVIEKGHNGCIVSRNNHYFIIDNQGNLVEIETDKKPYLLIFNYIYQSGKENDFKFVVKDIYDHHTISEFEADSILFLPTDWIQYLVISNKNRKSLIDFTNFSTVQDNITYFTALDFCTFISCNKEIVAYEHCELGLLKFGLSNATNFKLLGRKWEDEFRRTGISFDCENSSVVITFDGNLKYLKKVINDSIALYQVDHDSSDKTYQIINKNTAEIIVDSIYDYQSISNISQSLILRKFEEFYNNNDSLIRVPSDYIVFSKYGNCYKEPFSDNMFFPLENYFYNEIALFNKVSLENVFKINTKLILKALAKQEDPKLIKQFLYIFYNVDSLSNEDLITVLNDLIKKNPTVSELYYFRSKLYYQLNKIKEASMDIDSALSIEESFENILRKTQFKFMYVNNTKKVKTSIISDLKFLTTHFNTPNEINYKIYDLYWVTIDLMILYKFPKKEIIEYIIKLDDMIKKNPTYKDNALTGELEKMEELKVKFKIKN